MASLSFIPISAGTGTRLVFRPIYPQEAAVVVPEPVRHGGTSRRRGRVLRWSELDEYERREALAALPVRPFTPLEQAAVVLSEASETEQEDDEILLMALMRIIQ